MTHPSLSLAELRRAGLGEPGLAWLIFHDADDPTRVRPAIRRALRQPDPAHAIRSILQDDRARASHERPLFPSSDELYDSLLLSCADSPYGESALPLVLEDALPARGADGKEALRLFQIMQVSRTCTAKQWAGRRRIHARSGLLPRRKEATAKTTLCYQNRQDQSILLSKIREIVDRLTAQVQANGDGK